MKKKERRTESNRRRDIVVYSLVQMNVSSGIKRDCRLKKKEGEFRTPKAPHARTTSTKGS